MPVNDHAFLFKNLWLVVAISMGGGGFVSQVAGFVHNDLGMGGKLLIAIGAALVIFGSIYFFAPAPAA